MSQTSAPQITMDVGFAGLIAESHQPKDVLSRANPAAAVLFGYGVAQGTGDADVIVPASQAHVQDLVGVVVAGHNLESSTSGDAQYVANSSVPVMRKGRVWVKVEDAVVAGGIPHVRHTGGNEGQFRSDVDGANAEPISGRYMTSAGAGELAIVELNL